MKKMFLRFLSVIMAILMIVTAVPLTAGAATYSGSCGANLSWFVDTTTGILNITGYGKMTDYTQGSDPWRNYTSYIKQINLSEGVEYIGEYAFNSCNKATKITIPASLKSVGRGAFLNASSLTDVYAESIEDWVGIKFDRDDSNPMYKADNLYFDGVLATDIVIPETVTSIGAYAFCNYLNLKTITVPDSIKSIGKQAFYNASSITDVYAESIESWTEIDFDGFYSNPMYYAQNLYFDGVLVTDIVIPDTMTSIGDYTFYGCDTLANITIPDSITTIGEYAFYHCDSLTTITIPDSVTSIGDYAFKYCSNLEDITFLCNNAKIGYNVFDSCSKIVNVYAESVESWLGLTFESSISNPMCYADNLYFNNKIETKIVIPDSITTILPYAFYNCSTVTEIIIPESVTTISSNAFNNCKSLTDITIPSGVTTINDYVFADCFSLKNITISKTTTKIGIYAFDGCSKLDNMIIDEENPNYSAIDGVLFNKDKTVLLSYHNKSGTEYTIPDGVEIIGEYAFYEASFKKIYIPDTVTAIEKNAFNDCYRVDVYYNGTENEWEAIDIAYSNYHLSNMLKYFTDSKEIIFSYDWYGQCYLYEDGTLIINSSETYSTSMGNFSVSYTPWIDYANIIKKVIINGSFTNIGKYAFYGCTALESVDASRSESYRLDIGDYAFYGCTALKSIKISDYTEQMNIGNYAFYGCSSLKSIDVASNYYSSTIGESAFAYCSSLEEIAIPGEVKISDYAFRQCTKLKKIYICNGYISFYNFKPAENSFQGVVADIFYPYGSIEYNNNLNYNYGGTLTWIESCYGPCGPTAVWEYDTDKKILTISGEGKIYSLSSGSDMPWAGFKSDIKEIKIEDGINYIDSYAFEYCGNVESVELPATLKYLCTNAFNDCKKLDNLIIPDSVEVVGYEEFNRCNSLTDLYYFGTKAEWDAIEGSSGVRKSDGIKLNIHFLIDCSTPPTCTETGTKTYYQFDKTDVYSEMYDENKNIISAPVSIPKINHSFTEYVANNDATCMNYGTKTAYCDYNCGNTNSIQGDSYGEHISYTSEITTPATHLTEGVMTFTCICGDSYTEVIEKTSEHIYEAFVTAPTCTSQGYTTYTCACGDSYVNDYVAVIDHEYESEITTPATHLTEGVMTFTCECGETYTEVIEKTTEHDYVAVVTDPTCTEVGFTTYTCGCGDTYVADETVALGHDFVSGECTRCGYTIDVQVTIGSVTGRPGETVEVYLSFSDAADVKTMLIADLVYDSSKLTLVDGEWLEAGIITDWNLNSEVGVVTFKENKELNGNVFVLTFEIKENLEDSESEIDCLFGIKAMNENNIETALEVEVIPGSVKITNIIKGDVNGDEFTDSNDAIHLLYHTMLPDRYEVNQNCDFDCDGYVNSNDAIYLLYHTMLPERYPLS